jgi:hypothetical protein
MRFTKLKYNKETKTNFVSDRSQTELIERLGQLENILEAHNLLDNDTELERRIILGGAGYNRVKLAMGHKVYFISGKKIRKAILKGYANNGLSLDQLVITSGQEEATIPYTHIFISRREAKRARKARQIYKLNKEEFAKIFGTKPYKKSYLLETVRGTDEFIVVSKVLKAYYKQISKSYSKDELIKNFDLDIDKDFKNERLEYLEHSKHLNAKWL